MQLDPKYIKEYVRKALKSESIKSAVEKAVGSPEQSRKFINEQIPHWEELRSVLHNIKRDVIENLDKYLERFEANSKKSGMTVHWAETGKDAQDIILNLAEKNNVKKIVKSKSLTTEEIRLNQHLISNNIETIETDLGEYIVQLMDQIPSHLIVPALHLNRQEIGRLFSEKLGCEYTEDPEELLKAARVKLRKDFLSADMGITGSNFAVADPGCFCVVENEANAHLTLSLPRIHVAVIGIEKMLPDLKAIPHFMKALPISATGQKISSYLNFIGGPSREAYGEGPEEVHIVLLDNGRSKILQDPQLRETLYCIRCGACLNICPVYRQIGGHAYGWVYMGPIGIALMPQYLGDDCGKHAPFLSTLCGACYDVCPVKINLPEHLLKLRNVIIESKNSDFSERLGMFLWSEAAKNPTVYKTISGSLANLQKLLPSGKTLPVPGFTGEREFPALDPKGFRKRFHEYLRDKK
ncbi:MAG: iron-sulfur cluster-binding protein [bacterium]|nr:iron-sulfur cluster-binding protein [bacterium]